MHRHCVAPMLFSLSGEDSMRAGRRSCWSDGLLHKRSKGSGDVFDRVGEVWVYHVVRS